MHIDTNQTRRDGKHPSAVWRAAATIVGVPLSVPAWPFARPRPRRWSIRGRLLAVALLVALAAWAAGSAAAWWLAERTNERLLDERLAQVAHTVLAVAAHELAEIEREPAAAAGAPHTEHGFSLGRRYEVQIWSVPERRLLLRSTRAPAGAPLATPGSAGFGEGELAGERTRTFVPARGTLPYEVQVAERLAERDDAPPLSVPALLASGLLSLLAVGAGARMLVLRTLQPVTAAERALRERSPLDLRPLPTQGAPRELAPLLAALNGLFARVDSQLSRERGFTAAAAHELRSPLAALRLQAQVAARTEDPAERARQLEALQDSVDRCSHLLEQLLALNRVESANAAATERVEFEALMREALGTLRGEQVARGVRLSAKFGAPAVRGQRVALQTLLRNLLHNALRHVKPGGQVRVSSERRDAQVWLRVDDDGPGIPEGDRARAFERFVRLDGAQGPGVGLGLAIAQAVARAHGATIALADSPLGGLRVEVGFPAAAPGDGDQAAGPSR